VAGTSGNPNPWPTIGRLVAALVATGVLFAGLLLPYVGGLGLAARHEATKFLDTTCNLQETPPPQKTTLYASDGKTVIATLFSQDRHPVLLSAVPKQLQDALVATEDRRFYSHHGVDMRGLVRSAVSTSGGSTQGGSTLTMQYVKQMRYYQAGKDVAKQQAAIDQNLNRKIEDAKCAIYLESTKKESKQDILQNYLNIAFFGENSYGIDTAAQNYFGKPSSKLTLAESAMLVGLLRAPSEYDPFLHPEAAKARRNQVLQNLVDVGKLSQAEADTVKATPVKLGTTKPPVVKQGCANASSTINNVGFFCDYVVNWLETVGGVSETQLTTGGLSIVTTLDANLQNSMERNMSVPASSPMTAVLPAVDPHTGDVVAMASSKIYGNKTSAKDVTHTVLPIFTEYSGMGASTYKLFPLLTALQTGVPSSQAIYAPLTSDPKNPTQNPGYHPSNCSTTAPTFNADAIESFSTSETMVSATAKSSNTYFVGLVDQLFNCDLQPVVDMARKLGMKGLDAASGDGNLTIAQTVVNYQRPAELVLGDVGTSPLELAGAYAAIANQGVFNTPAPIKSITDETGKPVAVKRSPGTAVVSPQVALQATQILTGDTRSPGTSASQFINWYGGGNSTVAGKTGTSVAVVNNQDTQQNAALWFVGMTPNLVATSALINFDHPNAPAAGLPGLSDPGTQAYGAYASGVWVNALTPTLAPQRWAWADPASAPGDPVPPLTGMTMTAAQAALTAAGFKMAELDKANALQCASSVPTGSIAFYGPQIAPKGSTITVCPSLGVAPQSPPPPVITTPTRGRTTTTPGIPTTGGTTPGGRRTITITPPRPTH
jgi:membrane peptidoglycan carboxypeptidase